MEGAVPLRKMVVVSMKSLEGKKEIMRRRGELRKEEKRG